MVENVKSIHASLVKVKDVKQKIQDSINVNNNKISETKVLQQKQKNIVQRIDKLAKWKEELKVDLEIVKSIQTDFDILST